jgi:hypothetical protein
MTISYYWAHRRLLLSLGPARDRVCRCGAPAQEWAYQHTGGDAELIQHGRAYSPNSCDYAPMCLSCHRTLDRTPEWTAASAAKASVGGLANAARLRTDPEYAAEFSASRSRGGRRANATRRRCAECGMTTNPGALGRHLGATGHAGWDAE